MAQMNQLEAINYVFNSLLKKFNDLSDFYMVLAERPDLETPEVQEDADYLLNICQIIESHLTRPSPTTLLDFVKVCDELQKILPKPVDDSAKNDIVKKDKS